MAKKRNWLKIMVYLVVGFFLLFTILSAFSFLFSDKVSAPAQVWEQTDTVDNWTWN